jgi:6-phosphogluconolactonase (cycloisomerase 2 family)
MRHLMLKSFLIATLYCIAFSTTIFAQGKFVYTNNDQSFNNSVSGFSVDANGKLTGLANSPWKTGGGGGTCYDCKSDHKILVSEKGPFLFVANDGDRNVSVFHINPQTGDLSSVDGSPFGVGGDDNDDKSIMLAMSPDEKYLYAANPGNASETALFHVSAWKIENNGVLTPVPGSPFVSNGRPSDMKVSPDGKYLIVGSAQNPEEASGSISVRRINADGSLSNGSYLVLSHEKFLDSIGVQAIEISPNSKYLFTAMNYDSNVAENGSITVYAINEDATLTEIETYFALEHDFTGALQLSLNGKYLYRSRANGFSIHVYQVAANGTLDKIQASGGLDESPWGLNIDAEGTFLFTAQDAFQSDDSVASLKIGNDGKLTQVEDSPFHISTDEAMASIAVYPPAKPISCTINCTENISVNNDAGVCGSIVNYKEPTTEGDACGKVVCVPASGTLFPVGTTQVKCTSEGGAECTFDVEVKDNQAPTIFQQGNIVKSTAPNKCSATATFMVSASDNCPNWTVESDYESGAEFPKGETTVHITATDKAGNEANYSFTVTIVDQQAPSINCQADINVNNEPNQCGKTVNYGLPTVSDNCPGVGIPACNPPSGTFFPVGLTNVSCTVKDSSDNESQCSFKVIVKDIQPPQITCPADLIAVAAKPCDTGLIVNYAAPMVSDNCPNNLVVVCNPPSGSIFPVGSTTVTCTVTDGGNNQTQCSFKVTVYDVRLQDDSNPSAVLLFNSFTGEYRLCCPGVNGPVTGTGTIKKIACVTTLEHYGTERRLLAKVDPGTNKGNATFQSPPGTLKCMITDKNITNNTSLCP